VSAGNFRIGRVFSKTANLMLRKNNMGKTGYFDAEPEPFIQGVLMSRNQDFRHWKVINIEFPTPIEGIRRE
jgi:hypothetical protein